MNIHCVSQSDAEGILAHQTKMPPHTDDTMVTGTLPVALGIERGWFGAEGRPSGRGGAFKPLYVDLDTPLGSSELRLLRTTGVASSSQLAAFDNICAGAGLYDSRMRRAMLSRDQKQGYRVLLLSIDGEVCAGALFCLAQQEDCDESGTVLLDILLLCVAAPYRFAEGVQRGRGYGSRVIDALRTILLQTAGDRPASMLARVCSSAQAFYTAKQGFVKSRRAEQLAVALRLWYGAHSLTHYGNHPELTTLLWSHDGLCDRSPAEDRTQDAHTLLIERGTLAYCAAVRLAPALCRSVDGATLRNGKVCIRHSPLGGKVKMGLFPGPQGLGPADAILYSGQLISTADAQERREQDRGGYMLQLSFRPDAGWVDGHTFAEAISCKPNTDGRYWPAVEWAYDAGPACVANEDHAAPNAKLERRYIDERRELDPYQVIVPLRHIAPDEEIRLPHGSKTPRLADCIDCQPRRYRGVSSSPDAERKRKCRLPQPHGNQPTVSGAKVASASSPPRAKRMACKASPMRRRTQGGRDDREVDVEWPQVLENRIHLSADRAGRWQHGTLRVSVPSSAADKLLNHVSSPSRRTYCGGLRVGRKTLAGFDNWCAVEADDFDAERQRAHTLVISKESRYAALAHLPGLSEIVAAALQHILRVHYDTRAAERPPEWLNGHVLCQDDANARFSVHQDTTEAYPFEGGPPDRRVLYTVVIKLNEGGTTSMQVCGQREVFYRRPSGSGLLFRSDLHHRTCRASRGVWKLALFFGHYL